MRAPAWLALAASLAGCTVQSFEYQAKVTFASELGTVQLNHQPIAPGAVWAASYSSFDDALRNPSIVEVGDRTIEIGPFACASACAGCNFDHASLAFTLDSDGFVVTGTCDDNDQVIAIR